LKQELEVSKEFPTFQPDIKLCIRVKSLFPDPNIQISIIENVYAPSNFTANKSLPSKNHQGIEFEVLSFPIALAYARYLIFRFQTIIFLLTNKLHTRFLM